MPFMYVGKICLPEAKWTDISTAASATYCTPKFCTPLRLMERSFSFLYEAHEQFFLRARGPGTSSSQRASGKRESFSVGLKKALF